MTNPASELANQVLMFVTCLLKLTSRPGFCSNLMARCLFFFFFFFFLQFQQRTGIWSKNPIVNMESSNEEYLKCKRVWQSPPHFVRLLPSQLKRGPFSTLRLHITPLPLSLAACPHGTSTRTARAVATMRSWPGALLPTSVSSTSCWANKGHRRCTCPPGKR